MLRNTFLLFLLFLSNATHAETAIFCDECTSDYTARQVANNYKPDLECSAGNTGVPIIGENIQCTSKSKKLIFINPANGNLYSYILSHSSSAPWPLQISTITLPEDAKFAFKEIYSLHALFTSSSRQMTSSHVKSLNFIGQHSATTAINCPANTALDVVTDLDKLDRLKSVATGEVGTKYLSHTNQMNLRPKINSKGISLVYKNIGFNGQFTKAMHIPTYVKTFTASENPTSIKDSLLFQISILGYNADNMPIIDFELHDASRVAGYTLGALKGQNGTLLITNPCIKQRFEKLVESGALTKSETPIGGNGGGSSFPTSPPESGGGLQPSCKIIQFFQSDRLLYTFREC